MMVTPPPFGHRIKEFRKAHCAFHRKICGDIANFSSPLPSAGEEFLTRIYFVHELSELY